MLNEALPLALDAMTRESEGLHSPVAPVDLSQAIIGPGMAIFSRYDAVLEADGTPMTVKTALQLINRFLAEDDFDADTQFCLHWFEQHGWETGKFGEADTLARAKGTSVAGVQQAGVVESGGGNVRLLKWKEYPADWDPAHDARLPVWEALHQLIRAYNADGDSGAARVLAGVAPRRKRRGSWPIAFTRSANGPAVPRTLGLIMKSSPAGAASRAPPSRSRRRSNARCSIWKERSPRDLIATPARGDRLGIGRAFPTPRRGSHKSAQGNALGTEHVNNRCPERAETRARYLGDLAIVHRK